MLITGLKTKIIYNNANQSKSVNAARFHGHFCTELVLVWVLNIVVNARISMTKQSFVVVCDDIQV